VLAVLGLCSLSHATMNVLIQADLRTMGGADTPVTLPHYVRQAQSGLLQVQWSLSLPTFRGNSTLASLAVSTTRTGSDGQGRTGHRVLAAHVHAREFSSLVPTGVGHATPCLAAGARADSDTGGTNRPSAGLVCGPRVARRVDRPATLA